MATKRHKGIVLGDLHTWIPMYQRGSFLQCTGLECGCRGNPSLLLSIDKLFYLLRGQSWRDWGNDGLDLTKVFWRLNELDMRLIRHTVCRFQRLSLVWVLRECYSGGAQGCHGEDNSVSVCVLVEDDGLTWAQSHSLLLVLQGLNQPCLVWDWCISLRIFTFLPLFHGAECMLHHLAVCRCQWYLGCEHFRVFMHQSDLVCWCRCGGK